MEFIAFTDKDDNNIITQDDVLQENHYYPFGMNMEGNWTPTIGTPNDYQYNGKELVQDLGLGWNDYEARYYDAALGRFPSIDPLADHPNQVDKSPFAYTWNNPVNLTDPDGRCPNCITGLAGGIIGGLIGGGIEAGRQLWNDGAVTNWSAVGGSAVQGVITGGAAGFTAGASLATTAAVARGANVVGGTVNRTIQGQETTAGDVAVDGTVGAVLGAGGKIVGNAVKGAADDLSNVAKINNPVPDKIARVVPGNISPKTLGAPSSPDVFVTAADDIAGLNASQVAKKLTIPESSSGFKVIEFSTPKTGVASPINRSNPGFAGKGQTLGGAREFVIPNQPIPNSAKIYKID